MKRFGMVIAAGLVTGFLVFLVTQQIISASQPIRVLPVIPSQPMTALLSNALTAGIFWIGLLIGEFSAGILALKLYSLWNSHDTPEPVQDDSADIQKLLDAFLTN